MSAATAKLLQAAADLVGGRRVLARRLGISETLLSRFITNGRELPDALLLRAVDIIQGEVRASDGRQHD
jgi:DNA-binding transcriptional regulator YdaS (Cro superfamily)